MSAKCGSVYNMELNQLALETTKSTSVVDLNSEQPQQPTPAPISMQSSVSKRNVKSGSDVKCTLGQKIRDVGIVKREDFDGGPVSLDEIEPGLFLGNLTAATHMETLKYFKISHILTLDTVPLPKHIIEASFLTTKYVQIADMPREDILHHLDKCVEFIDTALAQNCNVLVHCYFGVSRSSSAVIAYIMKHHSIDYNAAYEFVKSKRRFVQPNAGFVTQLKLYRRMGCKIEPKYQKYKLYCLRIAGEQVRKAKILPQSFHNLIQSDPGITQTNPEPIVYRCRKCRRVLASRSHVLDHNSKMKEDIVTSTTNTSKTPCDGPQSGTSSNAATITTTTGTQTKTPRLLDQIAAQIRKVSLAEGPGMSTTTTAAKICNSILFVEPIGWMQHITSPQGRLNCPKCDQKLGNFSWINGCQCPCGETMTPAFYLIPSKVELSKAVQNVQTTI